VLHTVLSEKHRDHHREVRGDRAFSPEIPQHRVLILDQLQTYGGSKFVRVVAMNTVPTADGGDDSLNQIEVLDKNIPGIVPPGLSQAHRGACARQFIAVTRWELLCPCPSNPKSNTGFKGEPGSERTCTMRFFINGIVEKSYDGHNAHIGSSGLHEASGVRVLETVTDRQAPHDFVYFVTHRPCSGTS
jgi:hypothetical protein